MKVQETLLGLLTQQLEQARIAEAKDLPIVQVLDPAIPADRHARPRVLRNLVLATLVGMIVGPLVAMLVELVGEAQSVARAQEPSRAIG
jgi:uncharacterized protein involved in exopolysaccharide biosynthesis